MHLCNKIRMQLPHLQNKCKRIPKWKANIENLKKLTT